MEGPLMEPDLKPQSRAPYEWSKQEVRVDIKEATGATPFEWFEAWMPLFLVIIPIWWAWKQAKMAQAAKNAERFRRYQEENREHEYSDKTKFNMMLDAVTKRKDNSG